MPIELLTVLKFGLLLLLYVFLGRTVRAVVVDLYGPRRKRSPRPQVAAPAEADARRSRRNPKELVIHPLTGQPQVVPLSGRIVLGRASEADALVDDLYVSDEHAEILPDDGGGWSVRDLGSTNGTFLNGAKVTRPTPLAAGDQLRLGKTRIEVRR